MKISIPTHSLLSSCPLAAAILLLHASASAGVFTQTVNEASSPPGGDWYGAIWGTTPAAAAAGNDYITGISNTTVFGVRTINVSAPTNMVFNGDHLILTNGGSLMLKHASAACTVNVVLDGGQIIFRGANGSGISELAGTLRVNPNTNRVGFNGGSSGANFYNLGQDQTGGSSRNILLSANVSGSGNLVVNMNTPALAPNNTVQLSGDNSAFTGNWTNNNGVMLILSGSVNPPRFGRGWIELRERGAELQFHKQSDHQ